MLGPPEVFGPQFPSVIVAPMPTPYRGLSLQVETEATPQTGLDAASHVQCELIRSLNHGRLVHRLGGINPETSRHVAAITETLLSYRLEAH